MELVVPPSMKYNVVAPEEYIKIQRETIANLESFWASQALQLSWKKLWDKVLTGNGPRARWFEGGTLSPYFNVVGKHALGETANKPALIEEDEEGTSFIASYRELDLFARSIAKTFRELGVSSRDWVLIYAPSSIEAVSTALASMMLGAPVEFVFTGFGWWELRRRIKNRRPKAIVAFDSLTRRGKRISLLENLKRALENVDVKPEVFVVEKLRSSPKEWRSFDELLEKTSLTEESVVESSHPLLGFHIGYEESFKPLTHGVGGYLTQTVSITRWLGLRSRDTLFCTVGLGWITAVSHCFIGALSVGSTILVYTGAPDYPDWGRWLELIDYYSATVFLTTSSALRLILKKTDVKDRELDSLKMIVTTGEPMEESLWWNAYLKLGSGSSPLIDSIPSKTGRIPVFNMYIQTEIGSFATGNLPSSAFAPIAPGSAGLPLLGLAVDVTDESCASLRGEWGRLVLRKPWPALPVESPEEFERSWNGDCYDTGDRALMNELGYIYIKGRRDTVIKASGYRLSPGAIEFALEEIGVTRRAVVFGVPDEERFEVIAVATEGGEPSSIKKAVRELIGPIAEPSLVLQLEEFKGDKKSLRRELREKSVMR
ncbi:MAG: AMP-binding protein [Acidilobaceae archaeon]